MLRWTPRPPCASAVHRSADHGTARHRAGARLAGLLVAVAAWALTAGTSAAFADPPGRVGRVAQADGQVQLMPAQDGRAGAGNAIPNPRNWPLTSGDVVSVGEGSRAELSVGATRIRLGARSRLAVLQLDDDALRLQLLEGSMALALRGADAARGADVVVGPVRMLPLGAGLFRMDAAPIAATAWRQTLRVESPDGTVTLQSGQRLVVEPANRAWRMTAPEGDRFAAWAMNDTDPRLDSPYVSPEMTGYEDLAQYGDWRNTPEWGAVWLPRNIGPDWAPYQQGRWAWVAPWGWTWVDAAPWGFAPFHYGRWVMWRQRWVWAPGAYEAQPAYAPALVGWAGNGSLSASIGVTTGRPAGSPPAWFLLSPQESYVPPYRSSQDHWDRLNRPHLPDPDRRDTYPVRPGDGRGAVQAPRYGDRPAMPVSPPAATPYPAQTAPGFTPGLPMPPATRAPAPAPQVIVPVSPVSPAAPPAPTTPAWQLLDTPGNPHQRPVDDPRRRIPEPGRALPAPPAAVTLPPAAVPPTPQVAPTVPAPRAIVAPPVVPQAPAAPPPAAAPMMRPAVPAVRRDEPSAAPPRSEERRGQRNIQ